MSETTNLLVSRHLKNPNKTSLTPYIFILLPIAYLTLVMFWPLLQEIVISFKDTKLMEPNGGEFVGFENYRRLLANNELSSSVWITILYTATTVVSSLVLGVISALALDIPFRGRTVARSVMLFGYAVPSVAAILVWSWMFNDRSGVLNSIADGLGMTSQKWLTSPELALWSVTMVTVWQVTPLVMLVVLAALQSVPSEVKEAAQIDGADGLNVLRSVTIPHIRPSITLVGLLVTVWTIRRFEVVYLLTGGGPSKSTNILVVGLRQTAFENYHLGEAAVFGVIGLILAIILVTASELLKKMRDL
ncbi:carbohydrate ABC transporter permease [Brevibacterium aurantiacum]|uniref:Sugar ABC transporter permease n=1 Tax=Brevibacterium aurantiacum TaxID=273384 RepID=A0A556CAT1_BREAU|nr:sugar ABC transporter permease [Brevibacterium aurantiacum]TSI14554.1 sugar ABC transporter permease [Brevibacterium aurantiacum]